MSKKREIRLSASLDGQVSGASITVLGNEAAIAEELLAVIGKLWTQTGWLGEHAFKQTLTLQPKTGDDIKFTLTWDRLI